MIKFIFKKLLTFVSSNRSNDTYFSRIIGYKSKWYTISYNFFEGKTMGEFPTVLQIIFYKKSNYTAQRGLTATSRKEEEQKEQKL